MARQPRRRTCTCGKPKDENGRCTATPSCSDFQSRRALFGSINKRVQARAAGATWIGLANERVSAAAGAINPIQALRTEQARERALRGWRKRPPSK